MHEDRHSASSEDMASNFPRYSAAALGFRNYWYPVTWSRAIGREPQAFTLLGEPVMLLREQAGGRE